jgi:hypothetical protein
MIDDKNHGQVDIDEIKRRLQVRYNIEADELNALGITSEEQIREFYQKVCLRSVELESDAEEDDGKDKVPVDGYKLPAHYASKLRSTKKADKKIEEDKKRLVHEVAQATLHPDARVSYDEVKSAMKDVANIGRKKAVRAVKPKPKAKE